MSADTPHAAAAEAIACLLSGQDLAARGQEVAELFKDAQQIRELADGYAFAFGGDDATAGKLVEFVMIERRCCPFFRFGLTFEPHDRAIWLELRGGEGVKEMVAGTFVEILREHAVAEVEGLQREG